MTGIELKEWAESNGLSAVNIASKVAMTSQAVEKWFAKTGPLPRRTLFTLRGAGFRLPSDNVTNRAQASRRQL